MPLCQLCWWLLAEPLSRNCHAIEIHTIHSDLIELYAGEHGAELLEELAILFCVG